jgi:hypothetical protein
MPAAVLEIARILEPGGKSVSRSFIQSTRQESSPTKPRMRRSSSRGAIFIRLLTLTPSSGTAWQ